MVVILFSYQLYVQPIMQHTILKIVHGVPLQSINSLQHGTKITPIDPYMKPAHKATDALPTNKHFCRKAIIGEKQYDTWL